MQYDISPELKAQGKAPHELFMVNLAGFHLLLAPASIAVGIGAWGLLIPLFFSGLVITYIFLRAKALERSGQWFRMAHWKLAFRNCKVLMIGYALTGTILLLAWLLTLGIENPETRKIMFTVFIRIAVMPTVILVLVNFVLAWNGANQAARGEVPDGIVKRFPAPAGVGVAG